MTINEQALADGFAQLAQATSLAKVRTAGAALQKAVTPTATPAPTPAPAPAPSTTPVATSAWTDLVGVCTHLAYFDTAYGDRAYVNTVLAALGIKHIRDGWGANPTCDAFAADVRSTLGIKFTLVCDPRDGNDPVARVASLRPLAQAGVLDTIEGPNEPGGWGGDPNTPLNGWKAADWVRKIRDLVRADPAFVNVKLAAMSLADTNTTAKYQAFGTIAGLDYGVTHDYPGGTYRMTDAIAQTAQANARIIAGSAAPVIATETGFTTGTGGPYNAVTEQQQADLTVELLNIHKANGMRRTFLYELLSWPGDTSFEGGLSMVRPDRSLKPVFGAVKTLLAS